MFSFILIFFRIFFIGAITLFVLVAIARISGKKVHGILKYLKNISGKKLFRIYFLIIGAFVGFIVSLFLSDNRLFVEQSTIAYIIGGLSGGFIVAYSCLAVMNQLYDYLNNDDIE